MKLKFLCISPEGHLEIWRQGYFNFQSSWMVEINDQASFVFCTLLGPEFWGRIVLEEWLSN